MDKEKLINLKNCIKTLELKKNELAKEQETFKINNALLFKSIEILNEEISENKLKIAEEAKVEYEETKEKKLLGGIGIRVTTNLNYENEEALKWATEHQLCLSLDRTAFNKIAKTQDIDFVKKEENITVTFPKEIKVEE